MTQIDSMYPEADTKLFVDDTSMYGTAPAIVETLEKIVPAAVSFLRAVAKLKLLLSSNAFLVATAAKFAFMDYPLIYPRRPEIEASLIQQQPFAPANKFTTAC